MSPQESHQLNFEELQAEVAKLDLTQAETAAKALTSPPKSVIPPEIVTTYKLIRPFLKLLLKVPLVPSKIKKAMALLMDVLDYFIPQK